MKKFESAFLKLTNNKYPFIRFIRAEYSQSQSTLILYFLRKGEAVDDGRINPAIESEINANIASMLPDGIMFNIKYTKVYADEETIKGKLLQALQKCISVASKNIKTDDITITKNDISIDININVEKSIYTLISPDNIKEQLVDFLNNNFVEKINLEVSEKYISAEEYAEILRKNKENLDKSNANSTFEVDENGNIISDDSAFSGLVEANTIFISEDARQIAVKPIKNLLGKMFLSCSPMYIGDLNDSYDNVYVGGKIMGAQRREYNNKHFGEAPSSKNAKFKKNVTDEKLPMYSFFIDDTTGKLPVVCFLKDVDDDDLKENIQDDNNVVCQGRISRRNGELQIVADKIWLCDIDYSSIKNQSPIRREITSYKNVFPEKYFEEGQCNMVDLLNGDEVVPYLKGKTFVVFDFETTGTDTSKCQVVQIGAVKIVDGKIVETFGSLINPMCHIPEETSKIHGIYDEDVKNAYEIKDVLPDFYNFCRDTILVGQNVFGFDLPILQRIGKDLDLVFDNKVLDTLVLARNQLKLPAYNLTSLCKHFGIDLTNAHNANFDAIGTAKVFMKLAKNLK